MNTSGRRQTYAIAGHVVLDRVADGTRVGGTVSFGGVTAVKLGAKVRVVTAVAERDRDRIAVRYGDADFIWVETPVTTIYENIYLPDGRVQYCHELASPVAVELIPPSWLESDVFHLAPLTDEVPASLAAAIADSALVGVTPQGWLRHRAADGLISPKLWDECEQILNRADILVLSEHDPRDRYELERYLRPVRYGIVTRSIHGADIFEYGKHLAHVPAFPAEELDQTGAGDCYAAAVFLEFHRSGDIAQSCRFASAAAAFQVEGPGLDGIVGEARVRARMRGPTRSG